MFLWLHITCSFLSISVVSYAMETNASKDIAQKEKEAKEKDDINQKIKNYTEEYGAKYANLRVLQENLNTMNCGAKVPEFAGISSKKMIEFIKENLMYADLKTDWEKLKNSSKEEILKKAEEISKKLEEAFKKGIEDNVLENLFDSTEYEKIKKFKSSDTFMVRSTGKEDSKEFSNAGGNESVPNVAFETKALLDAIKTVVCSYVSVKSLQQRMDAAGEKFEVGELFMPVLVQKMIGEKANNKDISNIPSSGVLFTTDPQGYLIDNNINLTLVQSTFGHNEGVVNSAKGIETDTYRIDEKGEIYPVIRYKEQRLKPGASKELDDIENGDEIAYQSSLNSEQLKKLKDFSKKLFNLYGEHQDVEFVFNGDELNIVQTRPLTHLDQKVDNTYILQTDFQDVIEGETLIGNGGKVIKITSKDQVISADNLGVALSQYDQMQKNDKEKSTDIAKNVQLVLSQKTSPITSHEATIFRGAKKVVLVMSDPKIEEMLGKVTEQNPLYMCVQQGLIGFVSKENPETKGLISYPMMRGFSIKTSGVKAIKIAGVLNFWKKKLIGNNKEMNFKTWLRQSVDDTAKKLNLENIVQHIFKIEKDISKDFLGEFLYVAKQMYDLLEKPTENKGKILFLQKILESLYYQRNKDVIGGESLYAALADHKITQEAFGNEFEEDLKNERLKIFRQIGYKASNNEVKNAWNELVSQVNKENKEDNLQKLIVDLGDFRYVWLNSIFYNTWQNKKDIHNVLNFFDATKKQKLADYKNLSREMDKQLKEEDVAPGEHVDKWKAIVERLFTNFINKAYNGELKEEEFFDRYLARQLLYKCIDCLDLSTKKIQIKYPNNMPDNAVDYIQTSFSILEKLWKIKLQEDKILQEDSALKDVFEGKKYPYRNDSNIPLHNKSWNMTIGIASYLFAHNPIPKTCGDLFTIIHQMLLENFAKLSSRDEKYIQKPSAYVKIIDFLLKNDLGIINYERNASNKFSSRNDGNFLNDGTYQERFSIQLNNHSATVTFKVIGDKFDIHILLPNGGGTAEERMWQVKLFIYLLKNLMSDFQIEEDRSNQIRPLIDGFSIHGILPKENNEMMLENIKYVLGGGITCENKSIGSNSDSGNIAVHFPYWLVDDQIFKKFENFQKDIKQNFPKEYHYYIENLLTDCQSIGFFKSLSNFFKGHNNGKNKYTEYNFKYLLNKYETYYFPKFFNIFNPTKEELLDSYSYFNDDDSFVNILKENIRIINSIPQMKGKEIKFEDMNSEKIEKYEKSINEMRVIEKKYKKEEEDYDKNLENEINKYLLPEQKKLKIQNDIIVLSEIKSMIKDISVLNANIDKNIISIEENIKKTENNLKKTDNQLSILDYLNDEQINIINKKLPDNSKLKKEEKEEKLDNGSIFDTELIKKIIDDAKESDELQYAQSPLLAYYYKNEKSINFYDKINEEKNKIIDDLIKD